MNIAITFFKHSVLSHHCLSFVVYNKSQFVGTAKPCYFKPRMKDNSNKKEREKDVQIDKEDLILVEEVLQFVIPMSLPNKKIADISVDASLFFLCIWCFCFLHLIIIDVSSLTIIIWMYILCIWVSTFAYIAFSFLFLVYRNDKSSKKLMQETKEQLMLLSRNATVIINATRTMIEDLKNKGNIL